MKRDARKRERVWGIGASKKRLETRRDGRKMYVFFFFFLSLFFGIFLFFFFFQKKIWETMPQSQFISPTRYIETSEIAVFVSYKKKNDEGVGFSLANVKINYRFRRAKNLGKIESYEQICERLWEFNFPINSEMK